MVLFIEDVEPETIDIVCVASEGEPTLPRLHRVCRASAASRRSTADVSVRVGSEKRSACGKRCDKTRRTRVFSRLLAVHAVHSKFSTSAKAACFDFEETGVMKRVGMWDDDAPRWVHVVRHGAIRDHLTHPGNLLSGWRGVQWRQVPVV